MKRGNTESTGTDTQLVTAIGVFPSYSHALRAVEALRRAGFRNDQIGVMGPHAGEEIPPGPDATHWGEGAGIGAAAGGLAGLGLGAAATIGLMTPIGPAIAGGAILAVLASAATGAAFGTIVGSLVGLGIPDEDARWYASELEAGRVVVTVRAANSDVAQEILNQNGAINRPSTSTAIPGNALPATPY